MEDDLKILKVEYLSNHLLDHWSWPALEEDLKIQNVKYL